MSNKKLAILGLAAVAMVVIAVITAQQAQQQPGTESQNQIYLLGGLDPDDIAQIVIQSDDETLTLTRQKSGFVVGEKENYPAKTQKVNDVIVDCLDIQTTTLITDDPQNHTELGVTEEQAATAVRFYRPDANLITGIIIGDKKEKGKGYFARLVNADHTYEIPSNPWISTDPMEYIDRELINIDTDTIVVVTVSGPNDHYTLLQDPNSRFITFKDMPGNVTLKMDEARSVVNVLESIRCDDVIKQPSDLNLVFNRQYVCVMKDSTVYTLNIAQEAGKTYVTLDADFTDKTPVMKEKKVESEEALKEKEAKLLARDNAQLFTERHAGWIYVIPEYKADNLTKSEDDLLEISESQSAVEPAGDTETPQADVAAEPPTADTNDIE